MPPTFRHGKDAKVYVHGSDLHNILNSADVSVDVDTAETSHMGTLDRTHIVGMRNGMFTADGMMDGDAASLDAEFDTLLATTTDVGLIFCPEGDTVGRHAFVGQIDPTAKSVSAPVSGVVAASFAGQVTGRLGRGYVLGELAARTATSTSLGTVDTGGTTFSTSGLRTVVSVTTLTTALGTDLTLKVQDSPDDSIWSDIATITVDTTGATSVIDTTTGSVARYVRAQISAISSATVTFSIATGKL